MLGRRGSGDTSRCFCPRWLPPQVARVAIQRRSKPVRYRCAAQRRLAVNRLVYSSGSKPSAWNRGQMIAGRDCGRECTDPRAGTRGAGARWEGPGLGARTLSPPLVRARVGKVMSLDRSFEPRPKFAPDRSARTEHLRAAKSVRRSPLDAAEPNGRTKIRRGVRSTWHAATSAGLPAKQAHALSPSTHRELGLVGGHCKPGGQA